jgi:hypothetical protein
MDMDELTGWEEHVRDEARECGELAARRREAEEDARKEIALLEQEEEEYRQSRGFSCQPAVPSCSKGMRLSECYPDLLPF